MPCWRWPIGVPTMLLFYQSDTRCGHTFSPSHGSAHISQWPWFFWGRRQKFHYSIFLSLFHSTWGVSKSFRCSSTHWNVSSWGTLQSKAPFSGELQSLIYPKNRWLKIYGTGRGQIVDQSGSWRCLWAEAEALIASCSEASARSLLSKLQASLTKLNRLSFNTRWHITCLINFTVSGGTRYQRVFLLPSSFTLLLLTAWWRAFMIGVMITMGF